MYIPCSFCLLVFHKLVSITFWSWRLRRKKIMKHCKFTNGIEIHSCKLAQSHGKSKILMVFDGDFHGLWKFTGWYCWWMETNLNQRPSCSGSIYGCFPKWWYPHFTPHNGPFLGRKTHGFVGETHHFRSCPQKLILRVCFYGTVVGWPTARGRWFHRLSFGKKHSLKQTKTPKRMSP